MNVLLLEDDKDYADNLNEYFIGGNHLFHVDSVETLISFVKDNKEDIDCILLDIYINGMDLGLDAADIICKDASLPYIPVFFFSGSKPENMDADIFIGKKPRFDFAELDLKISKIKDSLANHWFKITSYLGLSELIKEKLGTI